MNTRFSRYIITDSLGLVTEKLEKLEAELKRTQRAAKHHRKFPGVPKIRRKCVR